MARTDNLSNYLTDVANAIKEKKGDQTPINASDFDTEITNLPSGGGSARLTTGHADKEGLRELGWSEEDINFFENFCIFWDEEDDDLYKVSDHDKQGILDNTTTYLRTDADVTQFNGNNCQGIIGIPSIDYTRITNLQSKFTALRNLIHIREMNTENVTSFYYCFSSSTPLKYIGSIDLSNCTSIQYIFRDHSSIKYVNFKNCNKLQHMTAAFQSCTSLQTIKGLSFKNVISVSSAFQGTKIREISFGEMENVTQLSSVLNNCQLLKRVDMSGVKIDNISRTSDLREMFMYCSLLEFLDIRNMNLSKFSTAPEYMMNGVPTDCLIIVKDETEKTWWNTNFADYTNVKTVEEYSD